MRISEIYAAVAADTFLDGDTSYITRIAIELLAWAEGVPVAALDLAAPRFARVYPADKTDLRGYWHGATHYQAWRRSILDAQMQAAPSDTDGDPWKALRRAARIGLQKQAAACHDLPRFLPKECQPWQLSDQLVLSTYEHLDGQEQKRFRIAVNGLRKLFDCELAQRTGLLPETKLSPVPGIRDHRQFAPMAPEIEATRASLERRSTINALDYVHRLASASGMLNGVDDTLEDLRRAMAVLPAPEDVGVPPIRPKMLRIYINKLTKDIGGRDYRLSEVGQAWSDLRKMARAAGYQTSALYNLSIPAIAQGMMPCDMSAPWAESIISRHKSRGHHATPSQCRLGCEQFDALRGSLPPEVFPAEPLGIRRTPPRKKQVLPPKDPVVIAWDNLYAEITRSALISEDYKHLWYVRAKAINAGMTPDAITQNWLANLRDTCTKDRLYALYGGVHNLRKIHGFEHLEPLRGRRQRHGGLPEKLNLELEEILAGMGAKQTTYRQYRLAIGVLAERLALNDEASMKDICKVDLASVDWDCPSQRAKKHSNTVAQLQKYCALPWTPDWQALQSIVVNTGLRLSKNPVPKLLSWQPGPSPRDVSLEWAQQLDRDLRSTVLNGPHGRADLAKTMARHVAAFDKLREIPEVAASGLMPEPIGAVRSYVNRR